MQSKPILILFLFSACFACQEKAPVQSNPKSSDSIIVEKAEPLKAAVNYLEKIPVRSFVLSCGSGCAMTYTAKEIEKEESAFRVKFDIQMYVDEVESDSFEETYEFHFKDNELDKIVKEGEKGDFLQTQMPESQRSFKEFGKQLEKF
jgi:hypothetical protein